MLAHGPATRNMSPLEYMGNLVLLIVGGNDTTRNSMTGGLLALHDHPDQWAKLRANPALIDSLVPEIIRWQTPLAHMRRTALARHRARRQADPEGRQGGDVVPVGQPRRERHRRRPTASSSTARGRASTCRSASASTAASATAWPSCSCSILWEEILKRFPVIEVVGAPVRVRSTFVRGFSQLPVRIPG